jgi:predicted RNA-binding Zn-ribbon protein involved in translation (DUF1610 family)
MFHFCLTKFKIYGNRDLAQRPQKEETMMKEEKKEVTCISCGQKVEVRLVPYGYGRIATCPKCGKLAYNGE